MYYTFRQANISHNWITTRTQPACNRNGDKNILTHCLFKSLIKWAFSSALKWICNNNQKKTKQK